MRRLLTTLTALLLLLLAASTAQADPRSCTPPSGPRPVDLDSVATFQFQGGANCWGWQAPNGDHYAIMGGQRSIGFVNLQTMTIADTVPTQVCQWRELKTYRNYCYAVSECTGLNQGMMIIDMSFLPDSVRYVGSFTSPFNVRSHCISIDTARGYCYLVRQDYDGFRIINLANPTAPVDVGGAITGDLHDMTVFNDTVYAAEGYNSSWSIWNCTNKSSPQMLTRVTIAPGSGNYVHNLWPTPDRHYLASTEEIPDNRTMKVWDISNYSNISIVDQYLGPGGIPHNAHIEDGYLFLAHYSSGFSILDFHNPAQADEVAKFDTYLPNDNADYLGCWGVYPHTNGSGWVYASNLDGRLFVFTFESEPYPASAEFSATSLVGNVPLTSNFTSCGLDLTQWHWTFGDGDSSFTQNTSHNYEVPGLYDVSLAVAGLAGADTSIQTGLVLALAETLLVADTGYDRGTQNVWELNLSNNVPISQLKLPITLSDVPSKAIFDSVSFVGCRTSYFESKQVIYNALGLGQIIFDLRANFGGGSPDLQPGDGPIAKVYLTISNNAQGGSTIDLSTIAIGPHALNVVTSGVSFSPISAGATALIGPPCDCHCHADPLCDGATNIQDVVEVIDVAFRGAAPEIDIATCVHAGRTDVNCTGNTDVLDVITTVGVAFRGDDPNAVFCDPCL